MLLFCKHTDWSVVYSFNDDSNLLISYKNHRLLQRSARSHSDLFRETSFQNLNGRKDNRIYENNIQKHCLATYFNLKRFENLMVCVTGFWFNKWLISSELHIIMKRKSTMKISLRSTAFNLDLSFFDAIKLPSSSYCFAVYVVLRLLSFRTAMVALAILILIAKTLTEPIIAGFLPYFNEPISSCSHIFVGSLH